MKKNKTLMCIDPFTGNKVEAISMINKFSDKLIENMFSGTLNTGKLVSDCINEYCVLKVNDKELVSKEMLYSKGKTVVTGDNVYIDKTCKSIPMATQYNICVTAMSNFNGNKARIIEYNKPNDTIKVAISMPDGTARMATLNDAATIIKEFA